MGTKLNKSLFNSVVNARSIQPALTLTKIVAFVTAGIVHLASLGVAAWECGYWWYPAQLA